MIVHVFVSDVFSPGNGRGSDTTAAAIGKKFYLNENEMFFTRKTLEFSGTPVGKRKTELTAKLFL